MKTLLVLILSVAMTAQAQTTGAKELPKDPPKMNLNAALPGNLFVELAKAINPAVVNISTTAIPKNSPRMRDPMLDMLEQLYGFRMQQPQQQQQRPQQMGLGTGFIIREDGLIITNNHVIAGADIINVQLSEKSTDVYEATLVGSDERTDIALIKITPKAKLPVAVLGSSKDVEVGEWVAAFGNPFGHGHSMTKGIISSKGRDITEINKIPLLQTDASINPGNSGGPLVNTKGQVIGVNSAIDARAQGIGFAIPIDEVKAILPILESKGRIARGFLGTALGDLDPEAAEYLGLGELRGAVITQVSPGSPALKAGLKMYDIVTEFNGKKIRTSLDLMDAVADAPIGQPIKTKIIRNNKEMTLNVVTSERLDEKRAVRAATKTYAGQKAPFGLGFTVIDPTTELRKEWGLPDDMKQPVVIETERNSNASKGGLQVGDVILDVNKQPVDTAKDVLKALKKGKNTLRIARNTRIQIISIE
ncbi:trypsin-like peptidase domain-containing protein [Bdellovibrio bacteriovorus]|uniref:Probable periplasmic serine endoprotease DegP-like n=1 Tax=Bdellovibrio bacteriovorus str. Tiberius TaxID=1069642 RepID=K7ZGF0_BDEBC|nr:trypsin-like peptidase domain-containing protein [Bdellovibrio bacteriovorus]AFY02407.1 serine protease MucD precursor [Bdellovibrio bacteriovorus str. Tiberius]